MKLEIHGLHCQSCKELIEDILTEDLECTIQTSTQQENTLHVEIETNKTREEIAQTLKEEGGYTV